ncbi:MAG: LamG domain-containing protein [Mucilaginibacter sp.]
MKNIKNIRSLAYMALALTFVLASCQKGFDPKSYAPKKPLPTFDGYSSSKDISPSNLVAFWPFSGSLADSLSATAGTGTGTGFGTGLTGKGLQVSSTGYMVTNTPSAVKSLKSFTLSVWVNMPLNTGAAGVVSVAHSQNFWGNLDIFFDNGGTATTGVLKVHAFNNSGSTTGVDGWEGGYKVQNPWGVWTQIVVTYDNTAGLITVYYDGASAGTNTPTGFAPLDWSKANQMIFGALQFQSNPSLTSATTSQGWAASVNGVIDQVRVYNTALSSSQVDALYHLEKLGR